MRAIIQEQLKDFIEKQEKGELLIQKTHNLLKTILRKVSQAVLEIITETESLGAWSFFYLKF